nr:hypothetical protein CFP56_78609 [Quercus suber]
MIPRRLCEICGEIAKNITGIGDNGFMEEWNESRYTGVSSNSSDRGGGCWRGQPFCNFLMACLGPSYKSPEVLRHQITKVATFTSSRLCSSLLLCR